MSYAIVGDDVLIDVAGLNLDDITDEDSAAALKRILSTSPDCANSFQSAV